MRGENRRSGLNLLLFLLVALCGVMAVRRQPRLSVAAEESNRQEKHTDEEGKSRVQEKNDVVVVID